MGVDVNSLASQANDRLIVNGQARVGGVIEPVATALLPGGLPLVSATSLSSTATLRQGIAFGWQSSVNDNTLIVTPQPRFRPPALVLSPSQKSLTDYLNRAWNNSDRFLAPTFAYLSQLASSGQYRQTLRAITPQPHSVQVQNLLNSAPLFLGAAIECPSDLSTRVLQTETSCLWARVSGVWENQSGHGGDPAARMSGVGTRLGGQWQVAPGWFVGGSFGYGQSWANAINFSSTGDIYDGSLSLRHTHNAWTFAGSLAISSGQFANNRAFQLSPVGTLAGTSSSYSSHTSALLIGGRLRAAYQIPMRTFYLRPYADLDLLRAQMPGFQESGSDSGSPGLPLAFNASQTTALSFSPMLEFGGERQLDASTRLRPYLALGLSLRSGIDWAMQARIKGTDPADGHFQLFGNAPTVIGRLEAGLQVFRNDGFDVRLEYGLSAGEGYVAQVPSARFTYRF